MSAKEKESAMAPPPAVVPPAPFTPPPPPAGYAPGYDGPTAPPPPGQFNSRAAVPTAPPPPETYINQMRVWEFLNKHQSSFVEAKILRVGEATGGRSDLRQNQKAWKLTLLIDSVEYVARVNEGDIRHRNLWARFQGNWIGQTVRLRMPVPTDNTKAEWVIDCE
jgi:hypothetical protein